MKPYFFSSFDHSDEETVQILTALGGKKTLETGGGKYKEFWGAKRPKIQKFSRPKGAKMKEKEAFSLYILGGSLVISAYVPGFNHCACLLCQHFCCLPSVGRPCFYVKSAGVVLGQCKLHCLSRGSVWTLYLHCPNRGWCWGSVNCTVSSFLMDMEIHGKPSKIKENTPQNQHFSNSALRVKNASFAILFKGNAPF